MSRLIVHCINSFSSLAGGVGFALQSHCTHISQFNHRILTLTDSKPLLQLTDVGIETYPRNGPYSLSYSIGLERALRRTVAEQRAATVHIHGMWSGLGFSASRVLNGGHRISYIVSPHGMLSPAATQRKPLVKKIMCALWERNLINNSHYVHCLTKAEERDVKRLFPKANTIIIPHAISFPFTRAELKKAWQEKSAQPKSLLYLGRIHQTKGILQLIDELAARKMAGWKPSFKLKIVGMGDQTAQQILKSKIKTLGSEVEFCGAMFGDEKCEALFQSHGIILPSETEGLPMTLLEAAAHGLPIFATKECNLDWINSAHAGQTVPHSPNGIDTLIDCFDALSIPALEEMGINAYIHALELYSPERISGQWAKII